MAPQMLCIWLLLSRAPHSLHIAAPNRRARTNDTAVCPVPFWKRGGKERALGHPEPTTLFQEASCSLNSLAGQPARTPGPPRFPKVHGPPRASRSYLEVPSIQRKKHVPDPRSVWLLWSLSEGDLAIDKCNQVPATPDFPWNLPTQLQFSYLS